MLREPVKGSAALDVSHHPSEALRRPAPPDESARGQPDLVGRRGRRLLRRARRVPRRRGLRLGSGAAARGGREAARRRRRSAGCWRSGPVPGQCARWVRAAGGQVVATDLSAGMVAQGRPRRGPAPASEAACPSSSATAARCPFGEGTFDIVFTAYGVVPFVADSELVMREAARVLRPGGRFVFSTTHPLRWAFPDDPGPGGLTVTAVLLRPDPVRRGGRRRDGDLRRAPPHPRRPGARARGRRPASSSTSSSRSGRRVMSETWGGWSPLRGRLIPGTAIFVCIHP